TREHIQDYRNIAIFDEYTVRRIRCQNPEWRNHPTGQIAALMGYRGFAQIEPNEIQGRVRPAGYQDNRRHLNPIRNAMNLPYALRRTGDKIREVERPAEPLRPVHFEEFRNDIVILKSEDLRRAQGATAEFFHLSTAEIVGRMGYRAYVFMNRNERY